MATKKKALKTAIPNPIRNILLGTCLAERIVPVLALVGYFELQNRD
jgi:hypothetical protein